MNPAEELRKLQKLGKLTTAELAFLTGGNARVVMSWLQEDATPNSDQRQRIQKILHYVERINRAINPSPIDLWLRQPRPDLSQETPLHALAMGRWKVLQEIATELETPIK